MTAKRSSMPWVLAAAIVTPAPCHPSYILSHGEEPGGATEQHAAWPILSLSYWGWTFLSFIQSLLSFRQLSTCLTIHLPPCFYKLYNHIPTSSRSPTNFDKLIWYALFRRIASGIHSYLQLVLTAGAVFHTHLTRFHNNIHIELESSLASLQWSNNQWENSPQFLFVILSLDSKSIMMQY